MNPFCAEYGMGGKVSTQGDVYSFGILLLEMFTGWRPTDKMFKDGINLHQFANMGLSESTIEPSLLSEVGFNYNDSPNIGGSNTGRAEIEVCLAAFLPAQWNRQESKRILETWC